MTDEMNTNGGDMPANDAPMGDASSQPTDAATEGVEMTPGDAPTDTPASDESSEPAM